MTNSKYLIEILKTEGIPEKWVDTYALYKSQLEERGFPCIFEAKHLALLAGLNTKLIFSFVNSPELHYQQFSIKKRSGGFRTINAPKTALLLMQRWINTEILSNFKISSFCHAYVANRDIVTHASCHLNQRSILKIDISDFFGSIKFENVLSIFKSAGYSNILSYDLARICTYQGFLPQGAATSPSLSNIIFFHLDQGIAKICQENGLIYSRYSDDICISGRYINSSFVKYIFELLSESGFNVNSTKTNIIRGKGRRVLTGISIGSGAPLPTKEFRRSVRQLAFELRKGEPFELMSRSLDPFIFEKLVGKLAFWQRVEPSNSWVSQNLRYFRNLLGYSR